MPRKTGAVRHDDPGLPRHASMRPRPDAAENVLPADLRYAVLGGGFNEAAARCRGKRRP